VQIPARARVGVTGLLLNLTRIPPSEHWSGGRWLRFSNRPSLDPARDMGMLITSPFTRDGASQVCRCGSPNESQGRTGEGISAERTRDGNRHIDGSSAICIAPRAYNLL
jgi:hypothetical protein